MNKNHFRKSVYGKNASRKKGIVVFLLAAALLVSMVGMASAGSVIWYLTDTSTDVPTGVDYWMMRGETTGGGEVDINAGESKLWIANESSLVDCTFCVDIWEIVLDYEDGADQCSGYLDGDETVTLKMGIYDPDTDAFTEKCTHSHTGTGDGCTTPSAASIFFTSCPFTVPEGDYLALKLSLAGGEEVHLNGDGSATEVKSPDCGCDYPVPELPTIILMSAGLLALAGFVLYSRNRRRNGKAQ